MWINRAPLFTDEELEEIKRADEEIDRLYQKATPSFIRAERESPETKQHRLDRQRKYQAAHKAEIRLKQRERRQRLKEKEREEKDHAEDL